MKLEIDHLRKTFTAGHGDEVRAVDDLSLEVEDGEFLVILGPSGSGKTTLLRCIAGLERPDSGVIRIDGRTVFSSEERVWVPPERRHISMVFQSYALWPHMSVFGNVSYPLKASRIPKAEINDRVMTALETVGCGPLRRRYPSQLSGGQQQRVALARAIVADTKAILFDEPLSSVDSRVREELRGELAELRRRLGFSGIYITHDQTEAVVLADRLAVFFNGKIVQMGAPRDLYTRPVSENVANFLGAANRFTGVVESRSEGGTVVRAEIGDLLAPADSSSKTIGQAVSAIVRPEHCQIRSVAPNGAEPNTWLGTIERTTFLGYCTEYRVRMNDVASMTVKSLDRPALEEGSQAWVHVRTEDVVLMDAE